MKIFYPQDEDVLDQNADFPLESYGECAAMEEEAPSDRTDAPIRPSDINDASPDSLDQLVGHEHAVEQIRVALHAARNDDRRFDHALLSGGPGLGKSQICHVIGQEMGVRVHEVLGQSLTKPADLQAQLMELEDAEILHVDEAQEMPQRVQTALYLALDKRRISVARPGQSPAEIPIADFCVLLSTTDEFKLLQPLRDRMRLKLRLGFLNVTELTEVLRRRVTALGWDVANELLLDIARRSQGTPRHALRMLQSWYRCARSEGDSTLSRKHLQRAFELEGIDELGLEGRDRAYLQLVSPTGIALNVAASRLGLQSKTVSEVVEPYLLRAGLIFKDGKSRRHLTSAGQDYVAKIRPEVVHQGVRS